MRCFHLVHPATEVCRGADSWSRRVLFSHVFAFGRDRAVGGYCGLGCDDAVGDIAGYEDRAGCSGLGQVEAQTAMRGSVVEKGVDGLRYLCAVTIGAGSQGQRCDCSQRGGRVLTLVDGDYPLVGSTEGCTAS